MKPIEISQSSMISLRALERILNTTLGFEVELRDCTMKVKEWKHHQTEDGGRVANIYLWGHFLFHGDTEYPQKVEAMFLVRSYASNGVPTATFEWDATHSLQINGTDYYVCFKDNNSKAYKVIELGKNGGDARECARSPEYVGY